MHEGTEHPTASDADVAAAPPTGRVGRLVARGLLPAWAPMLLLLLSSLMTSHWAPLPTPRPENDRLRTGLAELRGPAPRDAWTVYHVLYANCRCSAAVFDHVAASERPDDVHEVVLLVGGSDAELAAACAARGMGCVALSEPELQQRLDIEAAPLFVVTAPDGAVRYLGGYTDRKQAIDFRDLDVVARLRAGEQVSSMPVFGCGVSASLQEALDPFGIKY